MSLKSFDTALKLKLQELYPNVILSSEDKSFYYGSDNDNELKVTLPLITFDRISNQLSTDTFSHPSSFRGGWDGGHTMSRDLPVNLVYQINIWSDDRYECDDLWREITAYFFLHSILEVKYENTEVVKEYPTFITNVDIDIDTTSFSDNGRLYRQIITLEVRDARLLFEKNSNLVKEIPLRTVTIRSSKKDGQSTIIEPDTTELDKITPYKSEFSVIDENSKRNKEEL